MKKIVIVVAVICTAVFIGMPYITGLVTEKTLNKMVASVNQQQHQYGISEIIEVNRGFRQSTYKFRWTLPIMPEEFINFTGESIEYGCDAKHGLIAITYQCQFDELQGYSDFINTFLEGRDPLSVTGKVSLSGEISHAIGLQAFSVDRDGESMGVQAGKLTMITDAKLDRYRFDGEFGGLKFKDSEVTLELDSVKVEGDLRVEEDGLYNGVAEFSLANIEVLEENAQHVLMNGLKMKAVSQINNENLNLNYTLDVEQLKTRQATQNFDFDQLKLNLNADGLNRNGVAELNKQLTSIANQGADVPAQQMAVLLPILESLLKKGLLLRLETALDHDQQSFKADIATKLVNDLTLVELPLMVYNPEAMLDKMQASADIQLPNSIVNKVPGMQQRLQANPLYQSTANGYQSSIILQKNNIKLNAQTINLNELIGLIIQSASK